MTEDIYLVVKVYALLPRECGVSPCHLAVGGVEELPDSLNEGLSIYRKTVK